jgi:hypothetical protein
MNKLEFIVQGSAEVPYSVVFKKNGLKLIANCSCPAGEFRQFCKHRIRILSGDPTGIISNNADAISDIIEWVRNTDIERFLSELHKAEMDYEEAKKRVSQCKKSLARFFMD